MLKRARSSRKGATRDIFFEGAGENIYEPMPDNATNKGQLSASALQSDYLPMGDYLQMGSRRKSRKKSRDEAFESHDPYVPFDPRASGRHYLPMSLGRSSRKKSSKKSSASPKVGPGESNTPIPPKRRRRGKAKDTQADKEEQNVNENNKKEGI